MSLSKRSVITIILVALSGPDGGTPVIKSIEISDYIRLGIGKGLSNPLRFSCYAVNLL